MELITITIAIENKLYERAKAVGVPITNFLYNFLLDEGIDCLEAEIEDYEGVCDE